MVRRRSGISVPVCQGPDVGEAECILANQTVDEGDEFVHHPSQEGGFLL